MRRVGVIGHRDGAAGIRRLGHGHHLLDVARGPQRRGGQQHDDEIVAPAFLLLLVQHRRGDVDQCGGVGFQCRRAVMQFGAGGSRHRFDFSVRGRHDDTREQFAFQGVHDAMGEHGFAVEGANVFFG